MTETNEQLVIDLARELYDRFVMGGWEPQDAHQQIREMLEAGASTISIKQQIAAIELKAAETEEDYRGQRREFIRQEAVRLAVQLADEVILEASDGSCEETDYLTAKIMDEFTNKVLGRFQSLLLRADLQKL